MADKKRMLDKERILRYLIRKGSLVNSYKVAREVEMERGEVLDILNELAKEDKVRLRSGSVLAITRELSEEEKVKTKSEVEELKERLDRLEKKIEVVFSRVRESFDIGGIGHQKISKESQSKEE